MECYILFTLGSLSLIPDRHDQVPLTIFAPNNALNFSDGRSHKVFSLAFFIMLQWKQIFKNTAQVQAAAVVLIQIPSGKLENSLVPLKRKKKSSSKKFPIQHTTLFMAKGAFTNAISLSGQPQSVNRESLLLA